MDIGFHAQAPDALLTDTLSGRVASWPGIKQCSEIRIAVAYVTVAGVRELFKSVDIKGLKRSYWLVGLDDANTQPGAIEILQKIPGAEIKVAALQSAGLRFHPKVYQFNLSGTEKSTFLIVGSNNLTSTAMRKNSEAFITVQPQTKTELHATSGFWEHLWRQGHTLQPAEFNSYKLRYARAKRAREKLEKILASPLPPSKIKEVLTSDEAELDPTIARTCWIECGAVTLMGRELEFKAEQGMFFGLSPNGGAPKYFHFKVSDGHEVELRMKYQENHMWRLQMNKEVPEVKIGLRPRLPDGSLDRSPYVAVFTRTATPDLFELRFVLLKSTAFERLRKKSERHGAIGHTTARQYGWC